MSSKTPLTYKDAGVDIHAGNALVDRIKPAVKKTSRPEVLGGLGGFGGLFHLGQKYLDPVLVSGTDGVGTKLLLAQTHQRLDTLGVDLVAMCVNDILVCGAEPLFFLDYFACGQLNVEEAARVIQGIAHGCEQAGCALIGGETAEMPGMYAPGEFDLAGFAVGAVERGALISGEHIGIGDHLIGLASTGPHSNGYSLIRRIIEQAPDDLHQTIGGQSILDALLAPTQIYVNLVQSVLAAFPQVIHGMAHITGGGLTENIIRVIPEEMGIALDVGAWPMPPIFQWLQTHGHVATEEMRQTFNQGIGYVLICAPDRSDEVLRAVQSTSDISAYLIGEVVAQEGQSRVSYSDD